MIRPPDTVLIALSRADGAVSIMAFVVREYGADGNAWRERQATVKAVEEEIEQWAQSLTAEDRAAWMPIQSWRPVSRESIPEDREFRNALVDQPEQGLVHDVELAKPIALARVRELRNIDLTALDVPWMKALGKDQALADKIEAQRQILRDQPNVLDTELANAKSIDDIKALVVSNKEATDAAIEAAKVAVALPVDGGAIKG